MKWISLLETVTGVREPAPDAAALSKEFRAGRGVGVVTLGEHYLFFRRLWKAYYISYGSLSRFYRRVIAVPAKIGCCTTGEVRVENLVLCAMSPDKNAVQPADAGQPGAEHELAQIQLPGERAAVALMEELRQRAPRAAYGRPPKPEDTADADGGPKDGGLDGGLKEAEA